MIKSGTVLSNRYEICTYLQSGAMGNVYLAVDKIDNKMCVIKTAKCQGNSYNNKIRLIREGNILSKLDHSSIPKAKIINNHELVFMVMDYIRGKTLEEYISHHGVQHGQTILCWSLELCNILDYLHSRKPPICHRDIKPSNILVNNKGKIYLLDFGSAVEYGNVITSNLGTRGFCAPEQYKNADFDCRSDIYSFGAVMLFALTEKTTVPNKTINSKHSIWPIIKKCMRISPSDRYQNCGELLKDLTELFYEYSVTA